MRRTKKPAEAGFSTTVLNRQFNQQLVQSAHVGGRVFQAVASGERRLVEEYVRQVAKTLFALLAIEFLDQRVNRVEFEDRLGIRNLLTAGFEDLKHLHAQVLLANGQDRRRVGQTVGNPHFADGIAQGGLDSFNQAFFGLGDFFGFFFLLFGVQVTQVQVTTGHVDEGFAVELAEVAHQPLIDTVGQQQHFDAFLAEDFQVRAVFDLRVGFTGQVVDLVLTFLGARQVFGQRHNLLTVITQGGRKAQQAGDFFLVGKIFRRAFFHDLAEVFPEALVLLWLVLRQFLQHVEYALGQRRLHGVDDRVFLQDFARHVQRQVVGVDHTLDEAQVQRQEGFRLVHHEHALHVQFQAFWRFTLIQVERRTGRYVKQRAVFQLAFDLVVAPAQRVFVVVSDVLVELLVLLVLHLGARAGPQGAGTVDHFPFLGTFVFALDSRLFFRQFDWQSNMVGVLLDDVTQAVTVGEFIFTGFEVQHDAGAAVSLVDGGDFELALTFGGPVHAFAGVEAGATAEHFNLVGDDEGRVEAHAELADQVRIFFLVARQVFHEIGGAGFGDSAQMGDRVFAAHADAVVFEGDGLGVFVEAHTDFQFGATFQQLRLGQGFET